jgi:hypothetical protein
MAKKRKKTTRRMAAIKHHYRISGLDGLKKFKVMSIVGAAIGGVGSALIDKFIPLPENIKPLAGVGAGALISTMDGELTEGIGLGLVGASSKTLATKLPFLQGLGEGVGVQGLGEGVYVGEKKEKVPTLLVALDGDEDEGVRIEGIEGDEHEEEQTMAGLLAGLGAQAPAILGDDEADLSGEAPAILGDDEVDLSGEAPAIMGLM